MKAHQKTIGICDEWITPRNILDALGAFDLDPCAAERQPWQTAERMLTIHDDGLSQQWGGGFGSIPHSTATSAHSGCSAWLTTATASC